MAVFAYHGRVEKLQQRPYGSQSLKYLLSGPLQEKKILPIPKLKAKYLDTVEQFGESSRLIAVLYRVSFVTWGR